MTSPHSAPRAPAFVPFQFRDECPSYLAAALDLVYSLGPGGELHDRHGAAAAFGPRSLRERQDAALRRLTDAVVAFAAQYRERGAPPEHLLIALKTIVRRAGAAEGLRELERERVEAHVVRCAIPAYYGDALPAELRRDGAATGVGDDALTSDGRWPPHTPG
jgi:hypothetical protein